MPDGGSTETALPPQEQGEKLDNIPFSLHFDRVGLESERNNIDPKGHPTLDVFLRLPERLDFPKGTTLIVGPNGIGKSTLLSVIGLMGRTKSLQEIENRAAEYDKAKRAFSFEEAREEVTEGIGQSETEKKKRGIAPNIAKHTTVTSDDGRISLTRRYNIPEIVGHRLSDLEHREMGEWNQIGEYRKGDLSGVNVIGSTQQIIDETLEGMKGDLKMHPGKPQVVLLDEPTSNADLQRTLGSFKELDRINTETTGGRASFVVATNEGLLALNRNIPRIDLGHPERGIHFLRDYPPEPGVQEALQEMGYVPTQLK